MKREALAEAYRKFFVESEAGQEFMKEVHRLIDHNHEKAEDNPELSRDHMQRAKGNREVLAHIQSVGTEVKKRR